MELFSLFVSSELFCSALPVNSADECSLVFDVFVVIDIPPQLPPHALGVVSVGVVSFFFHLAVIVKFSSIDFPSVGNQSRPSKVYHAFVGAVGRTIAIHGISSCSLRIVSPSFITIICFSSVVSSIPLLFISSFH
ncbi:hypothetical protein IJU97_06265 [bacterium]|nr:hypothetical protein [bacterium]